MEPCERSRQIGAYHDGELSGPAEAGAERHLESCGECRAELERLRCLSGLMASAAVPVMPPGALKRLHARVGSAREVVVVRLAERLMAAAAALLLVSVGWLWLAEGPVQPYNGQTESWETAAVSRPSALPAEVSPERQLARWIVEDLSRENGGD